MDRILDKNEISKTKNKKRMGYLGGLALVALAIVGLRSFLNTSISADRIVTAKVQRGTVDATLSASGTLVPEFEQKITVPVPATLEKVFFPAGATVEKGQPIVKLNTEFEALALQKLKDEQSLKAAQFEQQKLSLEKEINDLETSIEIKELQLHRLKMEKEAQDKLLQMGGTAKEDVIKAETDLKIATIQMKQLRHDLENRKERMKAQLQEGKLNLAMQQNTIDEQQTKIDRAAAQSTFNGVVTWVNTSIGSTVNPGTEVARVADLSSFKVKGSIADDHAQRLKPGNPLIVEVGEKVFEGQVVSVEPSAANGMVTFYGRLNTKTHPDFRPEMYVDIYLITERKTNTLFVKNGAAFNGRKVEEVFVVKGNTAKKVEAQIGLRNYKIIEVLNGLKEGDEIIVSNTSSFSHASQIEITD